MSGENWTPGPWILTGCCFQFKGRRLCDHHVSTEWTRGEYPQLGYEDDLSSVANVLVCSLGGFQDDVSEYELQATGNLIAAAPELYEALKAYVDACKEQGIKLGSVAGDAEAALAKARGEDT